MEKDGFDAAFDGTLEDVSAIENALEDRSEGATKCILRDLHKDVPEGSFEVALKGAL